MKLIKSNPQRGSVMIYILVAVGLLAGVTATMMTGSSNQTNNNKGSGITADLKSQLNVIVAAVQECTMTYPNQDGDLTATQQKNAPYPINPKDPYLDDPAAEVVATDEVSYIRCPGNPGTGASGFESQKRIFSGESGKFLPEPPPGFSPWVYYNGVNGVYVMTAALNATVETKKAILAVDIGYNPCQTDVTDLRGTGSSADLSTDIVPGDSGEKSCPGGAICFRHWFVQKASAVETDAGCQGATHAYVPPDDSGPCGGGLCLPEDM